jgi:hypothetical protein
VPIVVESVERISTPEIPIIPVKSAYSIILKEGGGRCDASLVIGIEIAEGLSQGKSA